MVSPRAVYVVDTDASVRKGLSRLAASAGFEPMPCASAEAFVGEVRAGNAACALLDLSDLGLRNAEVRIRVSVVATWLPVIALSARDDAQTRAMARELGARAFFRKPVDAAALFDSIAWVTRST